MQTQPRTLAKATAFLALVALAASCGLDDKPKCDRGQELCGGHCVDVSNDPAHCGACGTACGTGQVCDIGRCSADCDSGAALCDGRCRDLDTDPSSCGACGLACADDQVCSGGQCGAECSTSLTVCDAICRDLRTDPLHCGDCTRACTTDQVCADGICATACAGTFTNCGGACRDLDSDADHCGACGTACSDTQVCNVGVCGDTCDAGLTACSGDCVDTQSDARHCGACDAPCALGEGCGNGVCGDTQDAPTFSSTPVTAVDEDAAYAYAIVVGDLDAADTIMIAATTLPSWLAFVDNGDRTATLSGTPTQSDVGTHSVVLVTTDGSADVEQTFDIVVTAVDDPPVFSTTPTTSASDGTAYAYLAAAGDEEGATVTVTATTLPTWLTFTDNGDGTYSLEGTPTDAEIGEHDVALLASDGALTATQAFTITVVDVNDLPVFTSMEIVTATEDVPYAYAVTVTDGDPGDVLVLSATMLPSWLAFVDSGAGMGALTGTPTNANVGSHDVEIVVTDGTEMVSQMFTIVVTNTNDAPTFTSTAITAATEDAAYAYAITATDVDAGDTLVITSNALPAWLTLTPTGSGTATLTGTPANADVADVAVTLTVTDLANDSDTQSFTLVVTPVNDPPAFTSAAPTDATEDVAYAYDITTTDEESAPVTLLATTRPSWLSITDNGDGTASFFGTPTNADVGTHAVTLTVSDGVNAAVEQSFTVTVANVNDAPTFTSTAITTATEDIAYAYAITAADVDVGAAITITAPTLPTWLTFADNGDGTASLSGTPTNAEVGDHAVTLTVSDSLLDSSQTFTITVGNANDAPVFESVAVTAATEDSAYTYAITTSDPDAGATLTITSSTLPSWVALSDNGDGTATLSGTPLNADVGSHPITLTVTDGTTPVSQVFTIVVSNTNDAPTFTSTPVTSALEDAPYTYSVTGTDPDAGETLTISLVATDAAWISLVSTGNGTSTLSGTPTNAEVGGTFNVTLSLSDGDVDVQQVFTITVTNTNDAPVFTTTAITAASEDAVYTYAIATSDDDAGATLALTAPTLPAWLSFTDGGNGNGTLSGTPLNAHVGSHPVVLSVTDGIATVLQSFTIIVSNTNDAPTFTSSPVTSVFASNPYTYAITTADEDVGDTRTIISSSLPAWLTFTDNGDGTATLSGTPAVSDAGPVNVTLTVNDGDTTATQVFVITVQTQPPVAIAHSYNVIGNTEILVESTATDLAVARGNVFSTSTNDLLVGATDPDTNPDTLTAALGSAPANGSLVLATDGSFSYVPNAGYTGSDSFTYTLSDGTNTSNVATVTFTISSRVWYVNNLTNIDNAGAKNPLGGNGTSIDAFDSLPAFEAVTSFAGDVIFVALGDSPYDSGDADGLDLLPSQALIGQAANLVVNATLLSVGNPALRPIIAGTVGNAVTLSSGNIVQGVSLQTAAANVCLSGNGASGGSLADVTMVPSTSGTGIILNSHSGAFSFTTGSIAPISGGTGVGIQISGPTAPTVQLSGVTITNVSMGLNYMLGAADVTFTGGGINVTGGRAISVVTGASGGSIVFTGGATVTATNVAIADAIAVDASGAVFDLSFGNVTLTGSPGADDAISLTNLGAGSVISFAGVTTLSGFPGDGVDLIGSSIAQQQGTFTFASLATSSIAGTDVRVTGGRPTLTVHVQAGTGITNTAGRPVSVTGTNAANVLFDTGGISDTAGGVELTNNTNSSIRFDSALTITPAVGTIGVVATTNTGSTLQFGTLAVTTNGAIGISADTAATLNVTSGSLSTTGALGLSLSNIPAGSVTMTSTAVTNASGGGIAITNLGGIVQLGATSISATNGTGITAAMTGTGALRTTSGTVTATTGKAMDLTTLAANLVLGRVASSSSPTQGMKLTTVSGSITIDDGVAGTLDDLDLNAPMTAGLDISGSSVAFTASSIDADGAGTSGILLTNNTGSISIASGDVATSAGTEVAISGGTATITLGSSITNTTGKALTVASTTGGAKSLTGGITCDGTGVSLTSNAGGSITLAGTLDVDTTTSTAFDITGNTATITLAGTLDVQTTSGRALNVTGLGASSVLNVTGSANVLSTTTGIPASIVNAHIGASNATFRSISANGAPNGIVLTSTGTTGDFFVTGTGTTAGSGGTIQNTTGSAIVLASVSGVHLSNINVTTSAASGIESTTGTGVDDLDLTGVNISNCGNGVNEGAVYITTNLTGTCDVASSTFTGSAENNFEAIATSGSLALNVTGSTFSVNSAALGASGVLLEARNNAVATATFTSTTFSEHQVNHVRASAIDSSDLTVIVRSSTFTASPTNDTISGLVLSNALNADLTFDVDGNTFTGPTTVSSMTQHAVMVVTSLVDTTTSAFVNGYFRNNLNITNQNFGLAMELRGNAPHVLAITGNNLSNIRTRAFDYLAGAAPGDAPLGDLTLTNNTCSATAAGADNCALITLTESASLCTNVRSNTFTTVTAPTIDMTAFAPAAIQLESSGTDCGGACADANAHLNARNTLAGGAVITSGVTLVAPGSCALPTL